jgi:hypothetical protein
MQIPTQMERHRINRGGEFCRLGTTRILTNAPSPMPSRRYQALGRNAPPIGWAVTYTVKSAHHGRGRLAATETISASEAATKVLNEKSSLTPFHPEKTQIGVTIAMHNRQHWAGASHSRDRDRVAFAIDKVQEFPVPRHLPL